MEIVGIVFIVFIGLVCPFIFFHKIRDFLIVKKINVFVADVISLILSIMIAGLILLVIQLGAPNGQGGILIVPFVILIICITIYQLGADILSRNKR